MNFTVNTIVQSLAANLLPLFPGVTFLQDPTQPVLLTRWDNMSNEQMAELIKSGNKDLLPALWENVRNFVYMYCNRFYLSQLKLCQAANIDIDDLAQEGYFSLLKAVKSYDPEKGYKLLTYMSYHLKNSFNELIGLRTKKEQKDILNNSLSLYTPLGDDLIIADTVADDNDYIGTAESKLYNEELHNDLEKELNMLEPIKSDILRQIYYEGHTEAEAAQNMQLTLSYTRGLKQSALNKLRRSKRLKIYREDIISRNAYKSSFIKWKETGYSSTERTAIKLINLSCKG